MEPEMYDQIIEIAENRAYLNAVKGQESQGPNLDLLKTLKTYEECADLEARLKADGKINFNTIFHEPTGYYLLKCFLTADYSVDKAVFVSDVELYRKMRDPAARRKVAKLLYDRFVAEQDDTKYTPGESVFERHKKKKKPGRQNSNVPRSSSLHEYKEDSGSKANSDTPNSSRVSRTQSNLPSNGSTPEDSRSTQLLSLHIGGTNAIGVYGKSVQKVKEHLKSGHAPKTLLDEVVHDVLDDLRMDVFPRFLKSEFYTRYIQTKLVEELPVDVKSFTSLRVLGRGAFGAVNACIKKDSGKLYAMKCINKKRVMATDSVDTVMCERNFLSVMESDFVVCLKYAVQDKEYLYLTLDLMMGGDLKFHLNKDEIFDEERSRFYAAEVLLGLEHIHEKDIIYRDMKLENVLLDDKGHTRISDLGLAVRTKEKVKGYAGTPGYTAPEVILNQKYDRLADFFSFGVMIYRFLCGKKPFGRQPGDLDKNVVELQPEFPDDYFSPTATSLIKGLLIKDPTKRLGANGISEIKEHPWFNPIDFGLLEAGYIDPPFVPNLDEVNADSLRHIGRPNQDKKYEKIKLSEDFEKSLDKFEFTSTKAISREIVEVMEKADEDTDFRKFAPKGQDKMASISQDPNEPPSNCCTIS